jgi:spore coat protein CotH
LVVALAPTLASGCSDFQGADAYGLPLVDLRMTSEALAELGHGTYTETPVPCSVEIDGTEHHCRIAVAGATTRDDLKQNFDLELSGEYAGRSRHRLSALSGDPSGLRALLAITSLKLAGLDVPSVEPVSVWLNREYLGLYLVLEPIDVDFFERREDRARALYKARDLLATLESTANVEAAFAARLSGENHSDLRTLIENIALAADGQPNRLEALIDSQNVLRYMAGAQFIDHWDGIFNNYYLARTTRQPKFSILAWDLDQTFGRTLDPADGDLFEPNLLMRFLYANAHASYLEELERFDRIVTPERFGELVDEFEATIQEAYRHDPLLRDEPLDEQARALKRRSERQHEAWCTAWNCGR